MLSSGQYLFMKKLFLCSGLIFLTAYCFAQTNYCIPNRFGEAPYFDTSEIAEQFNITYGTAFNKHKAVSEELKLDIYYPKTNVDLLSKRPLILFVHGGGFLEGDKSGGAAKCREWARRGFVAASINYRKGWNCVATWAAVLCTCPDGSGIKAAVYEAIQDSRAAMRFLNAHADDYAIDQDYYFLAGESAGSITVLMSAYINQAEADSFTNGALYASLGALDSSGNNLAAGYRLRGIINSCGAVIDTSIIKELEVLPTISFHDENDCVVPYSKNYVINCTGNCYNYFPVTGSKLIHEKTLALGTCSKLYELKGSGSHCSFPGDQLVKKSSCFVRGILCHDCESGYSTNAYDTVPCKQDIATDLSQPESSGELASFQLNPNPTTGESLRLVFETNLPQRISITIRDILGRQFWHQDAYYEKGRHSLPVDAKQLSVGVHYAVFRTEAGSRSVIFMKQ